MERFDYSIKKTLEPSYSANSDIPAKEAFKEYLEGRGYTDVRYNGNKSDLCAKDKDSRICYFEMKMTKEESKYFGAASFTEWKLAFENPDTYRFVIAKSRDYKNFTFYIMTPEELMKYSTVAPVKMNFYFPLDDSDSTPKRRTAIPFSKKAYEILLDSHERLEKLR